jgi:hypothetical protein
MGICNKIAGILAPVLIGTLVLHGIGDLSAQVADADHDQGRLLDRFAAKIHAPTWRWPAAAGAGGRRAVLAAAGVQAVRSQRRAGASGAGKPASAPASSSSRTCGWACCACSSTWAWR